MDKPTQRTDAKLDETIEETFPASDAPANTVETGIRTGEVASGGEAESDASEEIQPVAPDPESR